MVRQYRDKKGKGEERERERERVRRIRRSTSKVPDSFFGRGPEIWRLMVPPRLTGTLLLLEETQE